MILTVNCKTRSKTFTKVQNLVCELMENSQIGLVVKQGDNLSRTLFSIFINDLVQDINNLNLGVELLNRKLSMLLYADDIALIGKSPEDLQCMLDTLHLWCKRWRVLINTDKSKCIHFRRTRSN